jgi:hypothetical protein
LNLFCYGIPEPITFIFTALDVIPWKVAVIVIPLPRLIPVNNPPETLRNAAFAGSELFHVTKEVTSAVEPSE